MATPYFSIPVRHWTIKNRSQYKQVKYIDSLDFLVLSNMAGRKISFYKCADITRDLDDSIYKMPTPFKEFVFDHQVVEIEVDPAEKYAFFSLTDFGKENLTDKVVGIDFMTMTKIFEIETKGKWSKVIKYHPDKLLFVSNWHSNDISVIDIKNFSAPRVTAIVKCGISPRGIDITQDGKRVFVTCFYSGGLCVFEYDQVARKLKLVKTILPPERLPAPSHMRHVTIGGKYAYISDLGRNVVYKLNITTLEYADTFPVGASPNTLVLSKDKKYLAVSCRDSNMIAILKTSTGCIRTVINTGELPTGLDFVQKANGRFDIYNTNFADDSIVYHEALLPA